MGPTFIGEGQEVHEPPLMPGTEWANEFEWAIEMLWDGNIREHQTQLCEAGGYNRRNNRGDSWRGPDDEMNTREEGLADFIMPDWTEGETVEYAGHPGAVVLHGVTQHPDGSLSLSFAEPYEEIEYRMWSYTGRLIDEITVPWIPYPLGADARIPQPSLGEVEWSYYMFQIRGKEDIAICLADCGPTLPVSPVPPGGEVPVVPPTRDPLLPEPQLGTVKGDGERVWSNTITEILFLAPDLPGDDGGPALTEDMFFYNPDTGMVEFSDSLLGKEFRAWLTSGRRPADGLLEWRTYNGPFHIREIEPEAYSERGRFEEWGLYSFEVREAGGGGYLYSPIVSVRFAFTDPEERRGYVDEDFVNHEVDNAVVEWDHELLEIDAYMKTVCNWVLRQPGAGGRSTLVICDNVLPFAEFVDGDVLHPGTPVELLGSMGRNTPGSSFSALVTSVEEPKTLIVVVKPTLSVGYVGKEGPDRALCIDAPGMDPALRPIPVGPDGPLYSLPPCDGPVSGGITKKGDVAAPVTPGATVTPQRRPAAPTGPTPGSGPGSVGLGSASRPGYTLTSDDDACSLTGEEKASLAMGQISGNELGPNGLRAWWRGAPGAIYYCLVVTNPSGGLGGSPPDGWKVPDHLAWIGLDSYQVMVSGLGGLVANGQYDVQVRAIDAAGDHGPLSRAVRIRTYPHDELGAVTDVRVVEYLEVLGYGAVRVYWGPAPGHYPGRYLVEGKDRIKVEWRESGGTYSEANTAWYGFYSNAPVVAFWYVTVGGLEPGETYDFRVTPYRINMPDGDPAEGTRTLSPLSAPSAPVLSSITVGQHYITLGVTLERAVDNLVLGLTNPNGFYTEFDEGRKYLTSLLSVPRTAPGEACFKARGSVGSGASALTGPWSEEVCVTVPPRS